MVMKFRTLEPAGTAEVLRAAQRDELMVERIHQETSDLLLKAAGLCQSTTDNLSVIN